MVLRATKGLNPDAVGTVRMKPGEGLVGTAFETFDILAVGNAVNHPKFKYFVEADEDPYHSFICVPIKRGVEGIGALTVQRREIDWFDDFDKRALNAAASQLAGSLENIRLLMEIRKSDTPSNFVNTSMYRVTGTAASPGCAYGPLTVLRKNRSIITFDKSTSAKCCTIEDFRRAAECTVKQLEALEKSLSEKLPESASLIFTAHFLILKDKSFTGEMERLIIEGTDPFEAVKSVAGRYIAIFNDSPHAYMKEKALDVEDLAIRILSNIRSDSGTENETEQKIAAAAELFPSDILKMASGETLGIVMAGGGVASHVAILARSLKLPLVIVDDLTFLDLEDNTPVLMDADQGNIYVNPSDDTVRLFTAQSETRKKSVSSQMADTTVTKDNVRVTLLANINLLAETETACSLKAEGVGLYRTEFPFIIRPTFPSEDEQFLIYSKLFDAMGDLPVTIRTLDAGGDKTLAYSNAPKEENPELGLRSIRFSFSHKKPFVDQIRAILRAAAKNRQARMMFPLISSVDEFIEAKKIVEECKQSLLQDGLEFNDRVAVGMMIELPSVLEIIDRLAEEADFFSVGTNDFVQYMLAADRTNKMVADYYLPHHPSVIRGLAKIVNAAKKREIDVSVCGEMAHEAVYIPLLLGLGIRTVSVDPQYLPQVQTVIAGLSIKESEELARRLLDEVSIRAIEEILGLR